MSHAIDVFFNHLIVFSLFSAIAFADDSGPPLCHYTFLPNGTWVLLPENCFVVCNDDGYYRGDCCRQSSPPCCDLELNRFCDNSVPNGPYCDEINVVPTSAEKNSCAVLLSRPSTMSHSFSLGEGTAVQLFSRLPFRTVHQAGRNRFELRLKTTCDRSSSAYFALRQATITGQPNQGQATVLHTPEDLDLTGSAQAVDVSECNPTRNVAQRIREEKERRARTKCPEIFATPAPTPPPFDCGTCRIAFGLLDSDRWCACCACNLDGVTRDQCVSNDGFCETKCLTGGFCEWKTVSTTQTTATTTAKPATTTESAATTIVEATTTIEQAPMTWSSEQESTVPQSMTTEQAAATTESAATFTSQLTTTFTSQLTTTSTSSTIGKSTSSVLTSSSSPSPSEQTEAFTIDASTSTTASTTIASTSAPLIAETVSAAERTGATMPNLLAVGVAGVAMLGGAGYRRHDVAAWAASCLPYARADDSPASSPSPASCEAYWELMIYTGDDDGLNWYSASVSAPEPVTAPMPFLSGDGWSVTTVRASIGCCIGRPFVVDNKQSLTADVVPASSETDSPSTFQAMTTSSVTNTLVQLAANDVASHCARAPSAEARDIRQRWLLQSLGEHASVASFAAETLQLMINGAPSTLLVRATAAQSDEIVHADATLAVATACAKAAGLEPTTLGAFPSDGVDRLRALSLHDATMATFRDGCIGETLAAVKLIDDAQQAMTDNQRHVAALLHAVGVDELRHCALAWHTIAWAMSKTTDSSSSLRAALLDAWRREVAETSRSRAHRLAIEFIVQPLGNLVLDTDRLVDNGQIDATIVDAVAKWTL